MASPDNDIVLKVYKLYINKSNEPLVVLKKESFEDYKKAKAMLLSRARESETSGVSRESKKDAWNNYKAASTLFCNVEPSNAITVYKAQGSTYDTVFIDITDILGVKRGNKANLYRGVYTAITRARNKVIFMI